MASSLTVDRRIGRDDHKADPTAARSGPDVFERIARTLVAQIRSRTRYLPEIISEDPEWLMVLELFIASASGRKLSVSQLCALSGVPSTTALRHVARLQRKGILIRSPAPRDRRVSYVRLHDQSLRRMRSYLSSIAPRWLAGSDGLPLG